MSFEKRAATCEKLNKAIQNDDIVDVFDKLYYAENQNTEFGKKPIDVKDAEGNLYKYRILSSSYDIYARLKEKQILGVPNIYELKKLRQTHVVERYINGVTLDEYCYGRYGIVEEKLYYFMLQLCDILIKLHEIGIVHNDIKPSNIMVDKYYTLDVDGAEQEMVWLIDYDASKFIDRSRLNCNEVNTTIALTKEFATHEQARGISVEETDIALLGQTFLKLLGGEKYKGIFRGILDKCSHLDYRKRYKNVNELKEALLKKKHRQNDLLSYFGWWNFRGRIGIKDFIIRIVIVNIINALLTYIIRGTFIDWDFGYWTSVVGVTTMIMMYSSCAKRLQDFGLPGWLVIFFLIFNGTTFHDHPFLNQSGTILVVALLCCRKGDELPNKYGDRY